VSDLKTAAHAYAAKGWHVFPLQPRGKIPFAGGAAHKDATIDPAQIEAWWTANPEANIGLALEASGLVVLDVDVGPKKGGFEALQELNAIHALPETLKARTGGGGMHAVYSRPEGCHAGRLIDFHSKVVPDAAKGSGLDLLGLGYIVAAPSIHASGTPYTWGDDCPVAPLPDFLARAYTVKKVAVERPEAGQEAGVFEGGRDNALFRLGCALRDTGITENGLHMALYAENSTRCSPPMEDHEVERIVSSVMNRVVPTKDVLNDTAFIDTVLPNAAIFEPIKPEEGRLSLTLAQVVEHDEPPKRLIPTGFAELDKLIGGGFPTRGVTALIAPPGSGKSALAVAFCLNVPIGSIYVSTELSSTDLKARIVSQVMGVQWIDIMSGRVSKEAQHKAIVDLKVRIIGSEIIPHINEDGSECTVKQKLRAIAFEVHTHAEKTGTPPFVVFDYMQDLARGGDNISGDVSQISYAFRNISKALDCAVVMVSATARGWYGPHPEIEHPQGFMGAGKDSGGIEYDAEVTLFLDVDPDYSKGHQAARIVVAKSRQGVAGFVGAKFEGARGGRWSEDARALDCFSKEHKTEAKRGNQMDEDDRAILSRIKSHGADPRGMLALNSGIPAARAKAAIYRLLAEGKLEARKEVRVDAHNKSKAHDVIGIPSSKQEASPEYLSKRVINAVPWLDGKN